MIGFQYLIRDRKINISSFAKEIGVDPSTIWYWFNHEIIPKKHIKSLAEKFDVNEDYLIEKVNDIKTYKIQETGFNDYEIRGNITVIFVHRRNGDIFEVYIDTDDLEKLLKLNYRWNVGWHVKPKCYFVKTTLYLGVFNGKAKYKSLMLHRVLLDQTETKIFIDHINHDTLNNVKDNLRLSVNSQNSKHRETRNSNNKSGYRNVSWNGNTWSVQLQIEGVSTILKRFPRDQLKEAGDYAEEMREKYYGEFKGDN